VFVGFVGYVTSCIHHLALNVRIVAQDVEEKLENVFVVRNVDTTLVVVILKSPLVHFVFNKGY